MLPNNGRLHYSLALAHVRMGEHSLATKQLRRAIDLVPDKSAYQYVLAVMLQTQAPQQAISLLESATGKNQRRNINMRYAIYISTSSNCRMRSSA